MNATIAMLAAPAAVFVWAALSDARRYLIPNAASVLLAALFAVYAFAVPEGVLSGPSILAHAATGAVVFGLGAGLFYAGIMGGGDVKLFAAAALWAGPERIADALLATALAGGVLGVAMLAVRRLTSRAAPTPSGETAVSAVDARLPYGIAIAAGGLWTLLLAAREAGL